MNEDRSIARTGRMLLRWSKQFKDFRLDWPKSKADMRYLYWLFFGFRDEHGRTVIEELEARGYDTKTLRIQIDLRQP